MTHPHITAVGSVALDTVETPQGVREEMLGGSVVHFAVSASFFASVGLVGIVGEDFPEEHIEFLTKRGVDLEGLDIVQGAETFRWKGSYVSDLNAAETHCTALNVFADFLPTLPEAYTHAPVLFLANISPQLQLHTLDQMPREAIKICDTMNLWIHHAREELSDVFDRVDVIIMNDGEARQYTGESSVIEAGHAMMSHGVRYCIIKKGEHGSVVFGRDNFFAALPAYPIRQVFDPTGAGDSFAGGVVGHIARTGLLDDTTIKEAMRWGTVMGSFNVSDFSCDAFRPLAYADVEKRMATYVSYMA